MDTMTTLSEIINKLANEGYSVDFNLKDICEECSENQLKLYPESFKIDRIFRFEGPSDPADEAIVYALSSVKYNLKGVLVNGYGISSNQEINELISLIENANN